MKSLKYPQNGVNSWSGIWAIPISSALAYPHWQHIKNTHFEMVGILGGGPPMQISLASQLGLSRCGCTTSLGPAALTSQYGGKQGAGTACNVKLFGWERVIVVLQCAFARRPWAM